MFALKQQHMASRWFNLPFYENCELCNMMFHYEFTTLLRDSSHPAWLKLVFSVSHRVDSELARYRCEKDCFAKTIVRSNSM